MPSKRYNSDRFFPKDNVQIVKYEFAYDIQNVTALLKLLDVADDDMKIKILYSINEECDKSPSYLRKATGAGVLRRIMPFIYSTKKALRLQTLKLVTNIISLGKAFTTFTTNQWLKYVQQFLCLYLDSKAEVIREQSSYALQYLTKNNAISEVFITYNVMSRMFLVLRTESNKDILYNTIQIIRNTMKLPVAHLILNNNIEFDLKLIKCFCKSNEQTLAIASTKLLIKAAEWRYPPFECRLLKADIPNETMNLILKTKHSAQQPYLLDLLSVLSETYTTALEMVEKVEFLKLCKYVLNCRPAEIPSASKLFMALAEHTQLIQLMYDLSIEDVALSLLRHKGHHVIANVGQTLCSFLQNKYCCEKLTKVNIIKIFFDICADETIRMMPYKNLFFKMIVEYIKKSQRALDIVDSLDGLNMIRRIFMQQHAEVKKSRAYVYILEAIYVYATHPKFKELIMNDRIYMDLIELLQGQPSQIIHILTQYIQYAEYRNLFVKAKGPSLIVNLLNTERSKDVFEEIVTFIKSIIIYDDMVLSFLQAGLMPLLKSMRRPETKYQLAVIEELIASLYNLFLPLKLHDTGRLEITDTIRKKFYLVRETGDSDFPFLDILEAQISSFKQTIYVIDYEKHWRRMDKHDSFELCDLDLAEERSERYKGLLNLDEANKYECPEVVTYFADDFFANNSIFQKYGCKAPFSEEAGFHLQFLNDPNTVIERRLLNICEQKGEDNTSSTVKDDCLAAKLRKLYQQYLFDEIPSDLEYYVKDLNKQMEIMICTCITRKYKLIAEYIDKIMKLSEDTGVDSTLLYDLHIKFIKHTIKTNIIPLELISCGRHCERALFFKFFCDMLNMQATLVKGDNLIYYNEVSVISKNTFEDMTTTSGVSLYIVDLVYNIGNLMAIGSIDADAYIKGNRVKIII